MKCPECRNAEMEARKENHRYTESGLPNVVLLNVEVRHCPDCGADIVSLPRLAELHRTIALMLINKPARLAPNEIRFLRKSLGWSGVDFGRQLHVNPSTVTRWESEKDPHPMDDGYELALRLAVAVGKQIEEYEVAKLAEVGIADPAPLQVRLRAGQTTWLVESSTTPTT